jgi:hypothetical protein
VYRISDGKRGGLNGQRIIIFSMDRGMGIISYGQVFSYMRESYQQLGEEFISDRMSYIILSGRWCNIIVLNVHAPCEDKGDDVKDSFYDQFSWYDMKIISGYFSSKAGTENISKLTIENESLHEISNDNGVRIVNFATSTNLVVKSTMFPHCKIHKYTWTSPEGDTHNQIDHILIDKRWHSSVLDVRSFRGDDCATDHYLVVAEVRERLAVSKRAAQKIDTERFNVKKLNDGDVKEQYQGTIRNNFAALENLEDSGDINRAWDNIRENIKISAQESAYRKITV